MTPPVEVLVLGATGTTGSRVAAQLREPRMRERGVTVRTATRRPRSASDVRFDWADPTTHAPALRGVSAVYLVAPVDDADPVPAVGPFLQEAVRRGVRRVVALSSSALPAGTPGLGAVHALVAATVPEWAVLRPSWFMQNFTGGHPAARGVRDGELVTATGDGRVAFVDAADIAAVAVRALTDPVAHDTDHVLTGPEALSYADAAAAITRHAGRPVRHRSVPPDELARRIAAHGVPPEFARVLAALDDGIRRGAEDRTTDTVERVTGRPPRRFADFVAAAL